MNDRSVSLRKALLNALLAISVIVIAATVVLWLREGIFPPRAFMIVMLMLTGNNSLLDLAARHTDTQVLVTVISFGRILIVAIVVATTMDFLLRRRLPMLYTRRSKKMKNHVILCGLGQVGYRILLELQRFDTEVTVIEANANGPFIKAVTDDGIPVIFEDAREDEVLLKAGLHRAIAVIAATDDDLTNVEIALDARELRPDVRVVLRLFDQRLATKIVASFDIQLAFSASSLAAPAFAAAAVDPTVKDSFYVGDVLFVHSAFWVPETSSLTETTVWDIWGQYDVNTLGFTDSSGAVTWHPGPSTSVPAGSEIALVGSYEQIQRIQIDHGIIDPSARIHHEDVAPPPPRYTAPSTYMDPGR